MFIDVIVAEVGSTTTVVNGFNGIDTDNPQFIGQGQAPTSVGIGDVTIGLSAAIEDLQKNLNISELKYGKMLGASSAAGGLKMTVHGLVYDMTAKAAKEAALGAGAIVHNVTAGRLRRTDLEKIKNIKPNIILIAGGLDYGERETALDNAEMILSLNLDIPVIYAGNCENKEEIKLIFENYKGKLYIADNVYPKIDILNVEPTRKIIQDVFEEHIVHAPGMSKVKEMINGTIIPVPGAVMEAAKILREEIGDLIVLDVGGATTDLHSVTEDSEEIARILINPEPIAKRTVEGDLGMFVNMRNVLERIGKEKIEQELGFSIDTILENFKPIPQSENEIKFVEKLCLEAVLTAVERHAGARRFMYGTSGRKTYAEGKDLTQVEYIIGTGGALTRLPGGRDIMSKIAKNSKEIGLYPSEQAKILIDKWYIMSSLGVLAKEHPESALILLKRSLDVEGIKKIKKKIIKADSKEEAEIVESCTLKG